MQKPHKIPKNPIITQFGLHNIYPLSHIKMIFLTLNRDEIIIAIFLRKYLFYVNFLPFCVKISKFYTKKLQNNLIFR